MLYKVVIKKVLQEVHFYALFLARLYLLVVTIIKTVNKFVQNFFYKIIVNI